MTAFRYMPASLKDLDDLLAIENRCFKSDRINRRQLRYHLCQGKTLTLVCKSAGEIAGYLMCFTPALPRAARIYSLAVLPEQRGQGIANALIRTCLKKIRQMGYRQCRLEVRASDKKTQVLYARNGFRQIEKLPAYYEDGRDGVRMLVDLITSRSN